MASQTDDFSLRPGRASDAVAIAGLLVELGYPVSPQLIPQRLANLAADGRTIVVVAQRDGAIVGLATGQALRAIHVDEEVAWLTSVVVAASARRSGLGRLLVTEVETWAHSRGISRMSVVTGLHRAEAHSFYERLGYEHTGRMYTTHLPRTQRLFP